MSHNKNALTQIGNRRTLEALKESAATLQRLRAYGKPRFDSLVDYFREMDESFSGCAQTGKLKISVKSKT